MVPEYDCLQGPTTSKKQILSGDTGLQTKPQSIITNRYLQGQKVK